MKKIKLFALLFIFSASIHAQNITKMEYWIDSDPGFDAAISLSGFTQQPDVGNFIFPVPANVPTGIHTIGVRSKDAGNKWSHTNMFSAFIISQSSNANVTKMEYWIDTDPGFDAAFTLTGFTAQMDVAGFGFLIPANLTPGIHTIGIRSKDSDLIWSHTNLLPIYIVDNSSAVILETEYFWDTDPGFNNSPTDTIYSSPISDRANDSLDVYVPLSLNTGTHTLFVRSKDSRGRWSHTNYAGNIQVGPVNVQDIHDQTCINVYPNPFSDQITVNPSDNEKMRVIIYDPQGKLIIDKVIQQVTQFDLKGLSNGMYTTFLWKDNEKVIHTLKLIKQ